YEPKWSSLDTRPLPKWYDEAKVGIFIHWGVFSVPSFETEWFWDRWQQGNKDFVKFMDENYRPGFTYADFAPQFTAEFYDPNQWADIFQAAGANHFAITSVSSVTDGLNGPGIYINRHTPCIEVNFSYHLLINYNLIGSHMPAGFLVKAQTKSRKKRFVYSWRSLLYILLLPCTSDITTPDTYWKSKEFLAWLYNDSPVKDTIVVNDRWGIGDTCNHGDIYTCQDRYNPGVVQKHKWENCMTLDRGSWGFNRKATLDTYLKLTDLTTLLAETVSCGGNLLMNVGPTHDGRILPIFEERLRQFGDWMKVNGEAIYGSKPWTHQNDTITPAVWYTSQKSGSETTVYAMLLKWPEADVLHLGAATPSPHTTVSLLGYHGNNFKWAKSSTGMQVQIPAIPFNKMPCDAAWVLKLTALSS
ncbi:hypothetical protein CAPTEDRAFT_91196, partial [Capitella teleta]